MSFEICYTGSSVQYKVAASGRKGDEFYDKMDALAKEYISLTKGSEEIREKIADVIREAGEKILSEKYPDGQYEIDCWDGDCITDNFLEKKQEAKAEELLVLCREYFTDEAKVEGFGEIDGGDGYEEFNTDGEISVDGEDLDMGSDWEEAYENHECEFTAQKDELTEQDWCVTYYVQWKSAWSLTIEEGEFDKEKLNWKNSMVHYGDEPINEDIAGRRPIDESIELVVGGNCYDF